MIEIINFVEKITKIAVKNKLPFMEATLKFCEEENLEIEAVAIAIKANPLIYSRIKEEAEDLHLIPKSRRLKL